MPKRATTADAQAPAGTTAAGIATAWTAERIRQLRGALSRPRFAVLVGVSANTVYRWELPDDSPHSLRPSAIASEALTRLEAGGGADPRTGGEARPAHWAGSALERGRWHLAYDALVASEYASAEVLLRGASSADPDDDAMLCALRARAALLGRGDARAAIHASGRFADATAREGLGPLARAVTTLWYGFALSWPDGLHQDRARALALLHGARTELEQLDERGGVFWSELAMGLLYYAVNELDLSRRHLAHACTLDLQGAGAAGHTWLHEAAGLLARLEGDFRRSALEHGRALEKARVAGDRYARARALAFICERRVELGDPLPDALAAGDDARALLSELGWPLEHAQHALMRAVGEVYVGTGRFDELEELLGPAVNRIEESGATPYLLRELLGRGALRRGELASARRHLDACRVVRGDVGRHFGLVLAQQLEAGILAAEGKSAAAAECWRAARRAAEAFGSVPLCGDASIGLAEVLVQAGDLAGAREAIAQAERDLADVRVAPLHACLARARARLLQAEGRSAAARVLMTRAIEVLDRVGDPFDARRCEKLLASWPEPPPETEALPVQVVERVAAVASGGAARVVTELCAALIEAMPGAGAAVFDASGTRVAGAGANVPPAGAPGLSFGDRLGARYTLVLAGVDPPGWLRALLAVAEVALEAAQRREAPADAPPQPREVGFEGVVDPQGPMGRLLAKIRSLRSHRTTVLVLGESGVGKELVARALHAASGRRGRLVSVNCAAVPATLFESQLFGHVRGAFTGADRDAPGYARAADGGTLLLDEVGELPLEVQPKLLRFLEDGHVLPVGASRSIAVDVRVLAATHRDLEGLVREGRLREDLFYRLNVVPLHVPALRERLEEVPLLAAHFLQQLCGSTAPRLSEDALAALAGYAWPGNVRQLRNEIERIVALHGSGGVIDLEELSPAIRARHEQVGRAGERANQA